MKSPHNDISLECQNVPNVLNFARLPNGAKFCKTANGADFARLPAMHCNGAYLTPQNHPPLNLDIGPDRLSSYLSQGHILFSQQR